MTNATNLTNLTTSRTRTQSIAFVAVTIALMAVSAWITISLGPIPFTLQMFAFTFALVVLNPKECMAATAGYLLLGAIGVPVFSGMRGGFGVLAGPTGGFLWGYIFGMAAGTALLWAYRRFANQSRKDKKQQAQASFSQGEASQGLLNFVKAFGMELLAGITFTAIAYVCGCFQYTIVANVTWAQAFLVCCAPFILVDLCKIVAAVVVANAVKRALGVQL